MKFLVLVNHGPCLLGARIIAMSPEQNIDAMRRALEAWSSPERRAEYLRL
jgi:hypothetical protein